MAISVRVVVLAALALAGCGSRSAERFGVADWQYRNITGQKGPGEPTLQEGNGPLGVRDGRRGESAVYPGGDSIAPPHPGLTYAASGQVTINFNEVDAKEAAKTILDDVLRTTYVIDPKVEGRVTVRSGRPVEPKEALRLLEAGLQQIGVALVVRGNVHYVVPRGQGLPDSAKAIVPAPREAVAGFSSRAVQLKHIAATEMAEILKPLVKEAGMVRVDGARNVIVLAGTGADHEAWLETIRTFDVDWLSNRSVAVLKVKGMPVEAMVKSLTEVLRNENIDQQLVRFLPLEAGNAVLAVAKTPEALKAARQWFQRIEAAGGQQLQLFSYQMRWAQANQVLPILAKIFGVQGVSETELASLGQMAGRVPGGSGFGTRSAGSRPAPGTAGTVAGGGTVFGAQPQMPQVAAGPLTGVGVVPAVTGARTQAAAAPGPDGQMPTSMRLMANEPTNTLLIYATEADYEKVRNVLRTVDVPPRQVLVEATIVEVALTDDLRYGVQYYLSGRIKGLPIQATLTNGDFKSIAPEAPGFGLSLAAPAKVVIDALNDVTQVNVISAPNVMVLNNQAARLVVGDQVPIATQSRQDPTQDNQVIVNTIELRDTGVIFEVTPRINSSGSVLLDIVQEVSSIKRTATATLTPTITQRKLSSSVTVEHGETIVLGGLFSTQGDMGRAGLPLLSQLPVVGGAFGRTTSVNSRTELIVLITPKIVNDKYESRAATNEMRRRIQELRFEDTPATERSHVPVLPFRRPEVAPVQPAAGRWDAVTTAK